MNKKLKLNKHPTLTTPKNDPKATYNPTPDKYPTNAREQRKQAFPLTCGKGAVNKSAVSYDTPNTTYIIPQKSCFLRKVFVFLALNLEKIFCTSSKPTQLGIKNLFSLFSWNLNKNIEIKSKGAIYSLPYFLLPYKPQNKNPTSNHEDLSDI